MRQWPLRYHLVDRFGRDPHVKAPRGEVSYSLTKLRRQLGHWLWQVDAGDLVDQPRLEWQRGGSCSELVPTALDPGIARAVMRGVAKDRGRAARDSLSRTEGVEAIGFHCKQQTCGGQGCDCVGCPRLIEKLAGVGSGRGMARHTREPLRS